VRLPLAEVTWPTTVEVGLAFPKAIYAFPEGPESTDCLM
jgi:hypothetical protein